MAWAAIEAGDGRVAACMQGGEPSINSKARRTCRAPAPAGLLALAARKHVQGSAAALQLADATMCKKSHAPTDLLALAARKHVQAAVAVTVGQRPKAHAPTNFLALAARKHVQAGAHHVLLAGALNQRGRHLQVHVRQGQCNCSW